MSEPQKPSVGERFSAVLLLLAYEAGALFVNAVLRRPGCTRKLASEPIYEREARVHLHPGSGAERGENSNVARDIIERKPGMDGGGKEPEDEFQPIEVSYVKAGITLLAFSVAMIAGIGFLIAFWLGAGNRYLGGTLAVFLAGLGVGFTQWAHWLTIWKEVSERRPEAAKPEDTESAVKRIAAGASRIQRRKVLALMSASAATICGGIVVSMFRSLGPAPYNALHTKVWKRGERLMTAEGKAVTGDMLVPGSTVIVYPESSIGSEVSQTVLIRVDPALLELPSTRKKWTPGGYIAYSRVCTHAGCCVGMYEKTSHLLMCPCHQSTFNILDGAQPTGGPAARPLPQLPLYLDASNVLRAAGGFSAPPGPGFWSMPS